MREQSEQRLDLQLGCMFEPYLKQPTKLAGPKAPPAHHHAPSFLSLSAVWQRIRGFRVRPSVCRRRPTRNAAPTAELCRCLLISLVARCWPGACLEHLARFWNGAATADHEGFEDRRADGQRGADLPAAS
jgi:hypothetical protein